MLAQTTLLLAEGLGGGPLGGLMPFILMIGVFYFLVLRPMKKQEDERKQRLAELKRGDKIVLTGGLLGRVSKVEDELVIVEIADKVKVRVLKKDVTDTEENALAKARKEAGKKDDDKDEKGDKDKDKKKADKKDDKGESSRKAG